MLSVMRGQEARASPERAKHRAIAEQGGIKRNFGLDLFRTVAILFVLVAHISVWGIEEMSPTTNWLHRLGWFAQTTGIVGVELFFVLSGFLVGGLALKRRTSLAHFYMRRWLRTLPAYFFVLALLLIIKPIPDQAWRYFLFLQPGINNFFSVSWSLCVEEWFYLILPLFLFVPRRYFFCSVIAIMAALCLLRVISEIDYEQMRRFTPLRMDALLMGVMMAWIKMENPAFYRRLSQPMMRWSLATIMIGIAALSWAIKVRGFYVPLFESSLFFPLFFTMMPLLLSLLLPIAEKCPPLPGKKIITLLSLGAYSLYLLHQEIFLLIRETPLKSMVLGWVVGLVLACVAAFVLYQGIEKPFMRIRDKKWPSRT